jgi:hypothetical protein
MTDNKKRCPTCGQIIEEREIALFTGMVDALLRVFKWCEEHNKYEFQRKEVKHLFGSDNVIARFGDWILFGGLVYRPEGLGKGHYGINKERTTQFFASEYAIPTSIWKNPCTGELRKENYSVIDNIAPLKNFLDENYAYISRYRKPQISLF